MKKYFVTLILTFFLAYPCFAQETPSPTDTSNTSTSDTGSYLIMGSGGTSSAGGQSITTDEFTGAATFNISIPVPPARGGVEPQLSLNYNSFNKNPNSWVGYGWELNVGMIERTSTNGHTDYYDGANFQVNLNGQKETLTLVNANIDASSLYGLTVLAGSDVDEYRAKIENAFNIYLHFRNTSDPLLTTDQGWVIIDKGGTRYYLGSTNQSRVQKSSHWIKQWLLDEVIDANGNTLQVTYDDEKYLETITYQDIEIEFYVSDLVNPGSYYPYYREPFYNADEQEHINKRLNTINIKENGTTIQHFSFDYTYADKNNFRHLNTVEQCDGNPANPSSECLPETTFNYYEDAEAKWETTGNYNRQASTNKGNYVDGMVDYDTQFMDMNADGLVDKVVAIRDSDEVYVYYNNGNDFVYISGKSDWTDPFYPILCPDIEVDNEFLICRGQLTSHHFSEGSSHQWQYLMDINGDNLPDRVRAIECTGCADDTKQADLEIAFNTGNGWSTSTVVWRDPAIDSFPGMSDNGKFFMDFNGDGLLDRVVINVLEITNEGTIWADGFNVYYNNGSGFDQTGVFWQDPLHTEFGQESLGRLNVTDGSGTKATIRDFNGDGLPDRMAVGSFQDGDGNDLGTGIHVYLNRNGLAWAQPEENGAVNEVDHIMIVDKATEDKGYINATHDWIDMNADGFLDRIEGDEENGEFTIFYFKGITPTTSADQLTNGETVEDPIVDGSDSCDKAGYVYNIRESNNNLRGFWLTHTMTADFNGDGYPDRLAINNCELNSNNKHYQFYPFNNNGITYSDSPTKWDYKKVPQPDGALQSVSSGAGMTTVIEYLPSSWPRRWSAINSNLPITHRHLPFNLFLAHKIYTSDYTMNPNDENTFVEASRNAGMRWMTYEYRGGNFFVKNAIDTDGNGVPNENRFAEFNGFQSIEKTVHKSTGETWDDIITTTYYHQALSDYDTISASDETYFQTLAYNHLALSGKPYYTQTKVGGILRSWQESDYTVDLISSSDMFNCDGICFPRLTTLVKSFQENLVSPQKTSSVSFNYDAYGNIAEENYYDSNGNEIITKSTSYYTPTTFAQELQIRNRPEEQNKEQSGTVYRKKDFVYDSKGNPLEENSWISG
ncbi:hypothetical protein KJ708_11085 [bacterium]|nr:hypothetical protein [bacterium]